MTPLDGAECHGRSVSVFSVSFEPPVRPPHATKLSEYQWVGAIPFILVHLLPLLAFYTGTRWQDWAMCVFLYWARMFGVTGVYHRYFSHRTYKTSRFFQFLLALLAMSSSQKGVLWWAANHRVHHKLSDKDGDPHDSRRGFWYSHCGWLYDHNEATDYGKVKDLARYPELVFLNKFWALPPLALGVAVFLLLGWSGLLIGFFLSTALLWHGTFTINSLSHMFGTRRYEAGDDSTNNWLLAIVTMGEGWHNNHHHFMGSTRQGFYWWEYDFTYYILRGFQALGLVWDIKEPPARVYDLKHQLPHAARASAPAVEAVPIAPDLTPGE
jgi:stearoyl-CoA desaturase (Delta-9 desaturase)